MASSRFSPIAAIVAASLLLGACGKTDTDPNTVSPAATLEMTSAVSGALLTVQNDGRSATPSPTPGARAHRGDGVTVKTSGSQLDRNMGTVELTVIAQSLVCENRDLGGNLVSGVPASGPDIDHVQASDGQPTALQIASYDLDDFLRQVTCPTDFDDRLVGTFLFRVVATNIKGKTTEVSATLDIY
jgi:hypothetical protein